MIRQRQPAPPVNKRTSSRRPFCFSRRPFFLEGPFLFFGGPFFRDALLQYLPARICKARQTCICRAHPRTLFEPPNLYCPKVTSALAAGHRRAPVSCRACLRPPLCSGLRASGLQRRQGARSLRDRQPPTALPALDRTSTRRHGANNRPKGHSGPSACKITCCGKASSCSDSAGGTY